MIVVSIRESAKKPAEKPRVAALQSDMQFETYMVELALSAKPPKDQVPLFTTFNFIEQFIKLVPTFAVQMNPPICE